MHEVHVQVTTVDEDGNETTQGAVFGTAAPVVPGGAGGAKAAEPPYPAEIWQTTALAHLVDVLRLLPSHALLYVLRVCCSQLQEHEGYTGGISEVLLVPVGEQIQLTRAGKEALRRDAAAEGGGTDFKSSCLDNQAAS